MHIVKEIQTMSEKVIIMVSHSIDSFVTTDMELANETIKADDEVDELFVSIRNRIVELIKSEHCSGDVAVDALMIVKYLERIADHAVNICEWVEFFKTGEFIRGGELCQCGGLSCRNRKAGAGYIPVRHNAAGYGWCAGGEDSS